MHWFDLGGSRIEGFHTECIILLNSFKLAKFTNSVTEGRQVKVAHALIAFLVKCASNQSHIRFISVGKQCRLLANAQMNTSAWLVL